MANWSLPTVASLYADFLNYLKARDDSNAIMFDSGIDTSTNLVVNTKRWNTTNKNWDYWTGSGWSPLSALYGISISGTAANATVAADSLKLGGQNANTYVRAVNGVAPDASGDVVVDMATKLNLSGGTITGMLTSNYGEFKLYGYGGSNSQSRLTMNFAGDRWFKYDGTQYLMNGADLYVNGGKVVTQTNATFAKSYRTRELPAGTTYVPGSDVSSFLVMVWGALSGTSKKGGVGGVGYAEKFYSNPSGSYSYTIGAKAAGSQAGTTIFDTISIHAPLPSVGNASTAGAVATGGDFNASGGAGGGGASNGNAAGGNGGPGSRYGTGGNGGNGYNATGSTGQGGNGGCGGANGTNMAVITTSGTTGAPTQTTPMGGVYDPFEGAFPAINTSAVYGIQGWAFANGIAANESTTFPGASDYIGRSSTGVDGTIVILEILKNGN